MAMRVHVFRMCAWYSRDTYKGMLPATAKVGVSVDSMPIRLVTFHLQRGWDADTFFVKRISASMYVRYCIRNGHADRSALRA